MLYIVFNKANQEEAKRYPEFKGVQVQTFNSYAQELLRTVEVNYKKMSMDPNKTYSYIYKGDHRDECGGKMDYEQLSQYMELIKKKYSLNSKMDDSFVIYDGELDGFNPEDIQEKVVDEFATETVKKWITELSKMETFDLNDDIYLTAQDVWNKIDVNPKKYNIIMIDEVQDMNDAQV